MSRILLTGATGLIGHHLTTRLSSGHEVWAVHHRASDQIDPKVHPVRWDLTGAPPAGLLPDRLDAVVHLAQSPYFRDFPDRAQHVFDVNVGSTQRLLDHAVRAGARHFVFASSGGVYAPGPAVLREGDPVLTGEALSFYPASKLAGELLVQSYARQFNLVILRFFFVYGPGQRPDMLIPRLVRSIASGEPITLAGAEGLHLNPTYVTDASAAVEQALTLTGSHVINVGGPQVLSLREVAEVIGSHIGRRPVFTSRESAAHDLIADITPMIELLGKPQVRFQDGARVVCDLFLRQGGGLQ